MALSTPVACEGCEREGHQLRDCRIRIIQFSVFNKKCPREQALMEETPKVAALTTTGPEAEVKPLSLKTTKAASSEIMTTNLRLEDVALGVFTPRMAINQKWVKDLAEDIKNNGQQKAIIVQYQPELPYPLIDGEHRVAALRLLGQPLVRAEVKPVPDEEAAFLAMKINEMHGLRLDDLERGKQLFTLQEKFGWSQEKLGKMYSRSQRWVSDKIGIYVAAAPELKNNVSTRVLTFTHAREIVRLPKEDQAEVVEKVKTRRLSSRKTKALVKALKTVENPVEKQLVLKRIPKLDAKQAEALTDILQDKPVEKRVEILEKPIEELVLDPGLVEPKETLIQQFECPCGCGMILWVNWEAKHGWWKEQGAA